MRQGTFDHDRLEVYVLARQFKRQLAPLITAIPRGNADLRDQLKRAARSITNNIAEGSGKWTLADKTHFFHIARGSAAECAAVLDELVDYGFASDADVRQARAQLSRIVAMLVRLLQSLEKRQGPDMGSAP